MSSLEASLFLRGRSFSIPDNPRGNKRQNGGHHQDDDEQPQAAYPLKEYDKEDKGHIDD